MKLKTIANIIIINRQNVNSEHLLAVIKFQRRKCCLRLDEFHLKVTSEHWTAKTVVR